MSIKPRPAPQGPQPPQPDLYLGWTGYYAAIPTEADRAVNPNIPYRWWPCSVVGFDHGHPVIKTEFGQYYKRPKSQYLFSTRNPQELL